MTEAIRSKLTLLYGDADAQHTYERLLALIGISVPPQPRTFAFSERDVVLICYGDHVRGEGEAPLTTLHRLLRERVKPAINTVHLLPFYPYSSDDGFSVIDYYAVNPDVGTWDDVSAMRADFRLMFDAVFNHISAQSAWFQAYVRGESPYDRFFIAVDPTLDLSLVRRPRTLPLLTKFETAHGEKHVWTTFSEDQVDLDFANPDVLIEMVRVLLFYVQQGAALIRLDAIAYLWKVIGTTCIHLPETHLVVQLLRDVLDVVAPQVAIITETNVPHDENISYFGDGLNEAQMVYQFSLPPLILHSFRTGDASALTAWANTLHPPSHMTSYFNFTASHDGVGVTPLRGLVPDEAIDDLCAMVTAHGGFVSYKNNADGSRSPYEMNITYFDAITHPDLTAHDPALACQRFMCSQAIMLAVMGVPGIYFHSLFGSRNDLNGVALTGRNRSINREKPSVELLLQELVQEGSIRQRVYTAYMHLLAVRTAEPAFHPLAAQRILSLNSGVFALERTAHDGTRVIALHNVAGVPLTLDIPVASASTWRDLLSEQSYTATGDGLRISLPPFAVVWLKHISQ
jgi:sucrose phosphorylase